MAIPLKANNTVSRRRRRVPKNYRRHGSIRETSTTWRNVSAKVSSICCRCNRRGARDARRLVRMQTVLLLRKLLLLAISWTQADVLRTAYCHSSHDDDDDDDVVVVATPLVYHPQRHPISPNLSPFHDPFQPIIRHLDSLSRPERTRSEIAAWNRAWSHIRGISRNLGSTHGRVPRYKYLFSSVLVPVKHAWCMKFPGGFVWTGFAPPPSAGTRCSFSFHGRERERERERENVYGGFNLKVRLEWEKSILGTWTLVCQRY